MVNLSFQYHSNPGQNINQKISDELRTAFAVLVDEGQCTTWGEMGKDWTSSRNTSKAELIYVHKVLPQEHPAIRRFLCSGEPGIGKIVDTFILNGEEDLCEDVEIAIAGVFEAPEYGLGFTRRDSSELVLKAAGSLNALTKADCLSLAYVLEACKGKHADNERLLQIENEGQEALEKAYTAKLKLATAEAFGIINKRYSPF